ncbi:MAG TPA: hypothetical protein VFC19_29050 [Candidatus Limnocylindrales bacterium]|nr:hypothetical protein [Candidatus Limnocylindrales bacterium]
MGIGFSHLTPGERLQQPVVEVRVRQLTELPLQCVVLGVIQGKHKQKQRLAGQVRIAAHLADRQRRERVRFEMGAALLAGRSKSIDLV